jgi:hypothetical protein
MVIDQRDGAYSILEGLHVVKRSVAYIDRIFRFPFKPDVLQYQHHCSPCSSQLAIALQ